jgi:hypothetical protein
VASQANLVVPEVEGAIYRWRFGNVSFEVDAGRGARILGFRFGPENILSGPEVNALNFGSTFWTSPQSDWGWPPVVEIDSGAYTSSGQGADIWFQSATGSLGIAIAKQFRVDSDAEAVEIEYVMENRSDKTRSVAPWEISRLPVGGITFFPAVGGLQPPSTLAAREAAGAIWFDNDPGSIAEPSKLFANGSEGWVAHIDIGRRMLLIKTFPKIDRGQQAPGEAEIELYADLAHTYVEVEQQGAYRPLEPGARMSWSVTWRLRRLPPGIEATVGNKDLLALVRALKARDQSQ